MAADGSSGGGDRARHGCGGASEQLSREAVLVGNEDVTPAEERAADTNPRRRRREQRLSSHGPEAPGNS